MKKIISRKNLTAIITGASVCIMSPFTVSASTALSEAESVASVIEAAQSSYTEEDYKELLKENKSLKEENEKLKKENEKLKVQIYDLQNAKEETDSKAESEAEVAEKEPVKKTTEEFLEDILTSYNTRQVVSNKYSVSEQNMMTDNEESIFYNECAEAERGFYEDYKNAVFDDLNIQYLCRQYTKGLAMQYEAYEKYLENHDSSQREQTFNSGYYNRAYVIVELVDYYNVPFDSSGVENMRENTAFMDSLNEAETRNAQVDHATVQKAQQLLNDIGFFCGNADGISGKRTVKSIKRFQEMYGYEPVDGMIDDELINQLEEVAKNKK